MDNFSTETTCLNLIESYPNIIHLSHYRCKNWRPPWIRTQRGVTRGPTTRAPPGCWWTAAGGCCPTLTVTHITLPTFFMALVTLVDILYNIYDWVAAWGHFPCWRPNQTCHLWKRCPLLVPWKTVPIGTDYQLSIKLTVNWLYVHSSRRSNLRILQMRKVEESNNTTE